MSIALHRDGGLNTFRAITLEMKPAQDAATNLALAGVRVTIERCP